MMACENLSRAVGVRMWELRYPQVEAAIAGGVTTAVVVVGSTEQHGSHLPLFTDSFLAFAVGEQFASEIGALLAPPLTVGCADHHLGFAGTISLPVEVMIDVVRAYCRSLFRSGFRRVVILSTHGGNFPPLRSAEEALGREFNGPDSEVVVLCDLEAYFAAYTETLGERGLYAAPLPHAEAAETSSMLALRPDLVDLSLANPGLVGDIPLERVLSEGLRAVSPNGVLGDPTGATAEIGEECLRRAVASLVAMYAERKPST